ncbi:MAG: carboxypeptidase-like regulatory domain-containing protein [Marinifilaceae bacterium]
MKKYTFIFTVLVALISLAMVSCDNHDDSLGIKTKNYSIEWNSWSHKLKDEDEGNQHVIIPKVSGNLVDQSGTPIVDANLELRIVPENVLKDETSTNFEGAFEFENVEVASYEIVIRKDGEIIGKEVLEL